MQDKKEIRILYLGTPEISAYVLERLLEEKYNIIGVISQIDREKNRKGKLLKTPTKIVSEKYNIPCFQFLKIKEYIKEIKELKPDLILTLAYGQIIPHEILTIPTYGCLNLHGSILPKYRGAAPMQFALLNGDKETGMTLMEMVDEMDAGRMFAIKKINIENDNFTSLYSKMSQLAFEVFDQNIQQYINCELIGEVQNINEVTFTRKLTSEDEVLSFKNDALSIHNKIRAFSDNIGAYFLFNNIKIKVYRSTILDFQIDPGLIYKFNKNNLIIGTSTNALNLEIIQKPGKKPLKINDFYNGSRDFFKEGEYIL